MSWIWPTITCISIALVLVTEIRNIQLRGALRKATLFNEVVARTLEATTRELKESEK